ncbi:helix-turn-helix domain-containing protein [Paenibacillus sp. 1P07SE]|uniref:helix-turn-helix domain-containing protein n=1 Tax=Paenibacillus sp. 1P07SE TaxID=3132209 RepID=UPI0039A75FEE
MKARLSSRFYKYFVSYLLLMLIILLATGTLAYERLSGLLQSNVDSVSAAILAEVKLKSEVSLQEMERIALQIPTNPQLSPFAMANGGYDSYRALQQMRMYTTGSSFIYDVAVAYGNSSDIQTLSSDGTFELSDFLQMYGYDGSYAKRIEAQVRDEKKPQILSRRTTDQRLVSPFLLYTYPFPGSRSEELRFAAFVIREQHFTSMIHRVMRGYDGYFYMLDEEDELIASTSFGQIRGEHAQWLGWVADGYEESDRQIGDEDALSRFRFTSDANGWTYVLMMPRGQFLAETRSILQFYVLSVLGIFAAGLFLSYLFAKQHYRPWRLLASKVNKDHIHGNKSVETFTQYPASPVQGEIARQGKRTNDEYSIVARAFHELTSQNNSLYSQMQKGSRLLKEQYVLAMLRGEEGKREETAQMLDNPQFLIQYPCYVVMLLQIDNASELTHINKPSQKDAQLFALMNIAEELAEEMGDRYALRYPESASVALVLNFRQTDDEQSDLELLAGRIRDVYIQYFRYSVTAGIGSVTGNRAQLGVSLREAEAAVQYRYYMGGGQVISQAVMKSLTDHVYAHPQSSENRLQMAIREGRATEAAQAIGEIALAMREHTLVPSASREEWRRIGLDIARSLGEADDDWLRREKNALRHFWKERNEQLQDIERELSNICASLCEHVENSKENKHVALLEQLMQWAHQHYTDNGVSLDVIAGETGLSPSYVTRFFKQHTGFSLMQYIDKLRMDKAKELLRTTDLKVGEIIEHSGYVDEANFRRKFRKQEGVSPINYRSISRME